jgi:hypothetical protein
MKHYFYFLFLHRNNNSQVEYEQRILTGIVAYAIIVYQYIHNLSNNFSSCCEASDIIQRKTLSVSKIMNRTTTVVVALIAAAGLSTMVYSVPEQRVLAWFDGGFGGGCGGWGGWGGCGGGFFGG